MKKPNFVGLFDLPNEPTTPKNFILERVLERFEKHLDKIDLSAEFGDIQEVYDSVDEEIDFIEEVREEVKFREENPMDLFYNFKPARKGKPKFRAYAEVNRTDKRIRKGKVRSSDQLHFSRY